MKKQTALLTTIAFLFTSASSGAITMLHAEETQTQQQTDLSTGLSIKALTAKAVDENPYMSNGDTNIHHDCYNTDTTDAVLPISIYPEINVSFEKTNANASPAIFFDSYGHAIVPLLGGLAIRDLNAAQTQTIGYFSPTQHDGGGYVIQSSYSFVDESNRIVCPTNNNHVLMLKTTDEEGNVTGEFYLDTQGNPTKSSLGEYGQLYERDENGRINQITYLDSNGNAETNSAGYTILKRTYYRDGNIDTDMYFDKAGNPVALSKGQYGIKYSGKTTLLMDKNGNVMLCVDNILNGFPFMVVVFGCVLCFVMLVLPKGWSILLTGAYVVFILYETLMFRETGNARTNFVLFSYAGNFLKEQSIRVGVINNIWLFVPSGTGLYRIFQKKWVLVVPLVFSVLIEATQYITGLGIAEFDDVFGNTLGGWIGVLVAYTWVKNKAMRTFRWKF